MVDLKNLYKNIVHVHNASFGVIKDGQVIPVEPVKPRLINFKILDFENENPKDINSEFFRLDDMSKFVWQMDFNDGSQAVLGLLKQPYAYMIMSDDIENESEPKFKVSVDTKEDFDRLMHGEEIDVRVQYFNGEYWQHFTNEKLQYKDDK